MASDNPTTTDEQIKALEAQLTQMHKLQELRELKEQAESQLAELARSQPSSDDKAEAEPADVSIEITEEPEANHLNEVPEVRIVERTDPADPPKLDSPGQAVLGAIKRTIDNVSGRSEQESDTAEPPQRTNSNSAPGVSDAALTALEQKLDALAEQIASVPHDAHTVTQESLQQVMNEVVSAIAHHSQSTEQQSQTIRGDLATIHAQAGQLAQQVADLTTELTAEPEEVEQTAPSFATPGGLEAAVCGESLAADAGLAPARNELISGFLDGDRSAMGLAGQLLLFQSAPAERMPHLLKDVGEAYYRWRPQAAHAADPFQHAMMNWLAQKCEQGGSANRIELVRPGDRYDAARHHAKTRGLEVTNVHGWVVLRDNGKVYTKAAVTVK
jgi:hypothetical protein